MKALLFLGSRRVSSPPQPPRLGERVAAFLAMHLRERFETQVVDPLAYPVSEVFKPAFAYNRGAKPQPLARLEDLIRESDAYVMLSPEYNHSMSPALADLLNHFPSSAFSFKPSLIATYSSGQWGGTRAAVNMRSFLAELGCLPVSAMVHFPSADQVFAQNGELLEGQDPARWERYAGRGVEQLYWWAAAASHQRQAIDPFGLSPAFSRTPAERNAPEA
ncbi:flavoprotein [Stenotrophomonas pictorum JCM 9942]|jgi:chromate reductase|uniref:Flavoprotein n=1 Tax=Stenotrophomonas pictorum JCM 9942 TaxID=1236960 RepID=A0A0R0ADV7_9GAMM|nr:NAD(P)H-dependent oxidoreductase [Stenotrophomonas pictorum]KRG39684.1 flavoprotein [Stenotrophomonas pictorum JCM 9942]